LHIGVEEVSMTRVDFIETRNRVNINYSFKEYYCKGSEETSGVKR
jgi:hypothetical protein